MGKKTKEKEVQKLNSTESRDKTWKWKVGRVMNTISEWIYNTQPQ